MSIFIFQKKISDVKGERKGCVMAVGVTDAPLLTEYHSWLSLADTNTKST